MKAFAGGQDLDQTITLLHVRQIDHYNDWIFSHLEPCLRGRVLEVGCGIGTYSTRLRLRATRLTCVDMVPAYVQEVRTLFRDDHAVDVVLGVLPDGLAFHEGTFDTAVCINVLEYIADDAGVLARLRDWLVPGGMLFVQVPAHQWLFGSVDRALGHQRRYTAGSLATLLRRSGFALELFPRYLYRLGIPGWLWFGRVARRTSVPESGIRAANLTARLSRAIERVFRPPCGLTLVAVAHRPPKG